MGFSDKVRSRWLSEPVTGVKIGQNGTKVEIGKFVRIGGVIIDSFKKEAFELLPGVSPISFQYGKEKVHAFVLDADRGEAVNISPDLRPPDPKVNGDVGGYGFILKTNPSLLGQMIDAAMVLSAYSIEPSRRKLIITGFLSLLVGLWLGGVMW
jgi:hypothetical protein